MSFKNASQLIRYGVIQREVTSDCFTGRSIVCRWRVRNRAEGYYLIGVVAVGCHCRRPTLYIRKGPIV